MHIPVTRIRSTSALLLAALLAACGGGGGAATRAPTPIEDLRTVEVAAGGTGTARTWDGVVEAVHTAVLSAQTHGRVVEVPRDVDDPVAAGDVLVRLSAVEQQAAEDVARARWLAAQAAAAEAESTLRRYLGLSQGQYVSKAQLDQAQASRNAAAATRDAAFAQVASARQQRAYTTVRAPFAGVVGRRDVQPGESVESGQRLMTVISPEALRIEVSVPQSDAEAIRTAPLATIRLDDGRSIESAQATLFPAADIATHAVRVRLPLPRLDPAPRPGSTAKVVFPALQGPAYPRIPASALLRRGELSAVYVVAAGRVSLRQLRLGTRTGDDVDVIAGLKPGEVIAVDPVAAQQALVAARGGH